MSEATWAWENKKQTPYSLEGREWLSEGRWNGGKAGACVLRTKHRDRVEGRQGQREGVQTSLAWRVGEQGQGTACSVPLTWRNAWRGGGCRVGTGRCLLLLGQFSFGFIFNFCVKMRFLVPLVKTCSLNAVFLVLSEDNWRPLSWMLSIWNLRNVLNVLLLRGCDASYIELKIPNLFFITLNGAKKTT